MVFLHHQSIQSQPHPPCNNGVCVVRVLQENAPCCHANNQNQIHCSFRKQYHFDKHVCVRSNAVCIYQYNQQSASGTQRWVPPIRCLVVRGNRLQLLYAHLHLQVHSDKQEV